MQFLYGTIAAIKALAILIILKKLKEVKGWTIVQGKKRTTYV